MEQLIAEKMQSKLLSLVQENQELYDKVQDALNRYKCLIDENAKLIKMLIGNGIPMEKILEAINEQEERNPVV